MRPTVFLALALSLGCSSGPSHHFRMINARRTPRAEACAAPPLHTDHGPSTPREAIAVVTAECSDSHPEQCRTALQRAACEANADAVVDVDARPLRGGRVRMVGTAVEWHAP
ncbi:MAG: hypothetical protein Q7V43_01320 [Myxococcales bacterium]|nr:hypothetical protein [Myxococcales bacterium]